MQSFVMIDKDEYDSHAHIPKREYEKILEKAQEKDKPSFERAMFIYDSLVKNLQNKPKITEGQLAEYLVNRRDYFIKECEERFGVEATALDKISR